jgi:peptidoglycan/LPS O-acetylase OafA/YrhL
LKKVSYLEIVISTPIAMMKVILMLACLASASHGRRVQGPAEKLSVEEPSANSNPSSEENAKPSALSNLLFALNPVPPATRFAKSAYSTLQSLAMSPPAAVHPSSPQARTNSQSIPAMSVSEDSADSANSMRDGTEAGVDEDAPQAEKGTYEAAAAAASGLAAAAAFTAYSRREDVKMLADAPAPKKKPRIDAFDSLRFFLIAYIASGHFIFTATKNPLILAAISQINVVVGAFFVLSGYVAAYTTTELGERKYNAARLDNPVFFTVSRVMGFWPLHMLVLAIFSPMFFWVDSTFSGTLTAVWHGLLSGSLMQAWFPLSAEVWNAPTWFLSALTFSLMVLSYCLKVLAVQSKKQLRRTLVILSGLCFLPRLAYSYDLGCWGIFEGLLNARTHPNYALFNSLRFSPLGALLEVLMGAAACRLVMLDTDKETENTGSTLWPLAGMIGILGLRTAGVVALNDMLVRSLIFIPLFIKFLMRLHRESVGSLPKLVPQFLNLGIFKWLGGISFPIFIVHGPIGQLFYKKAVATKVFGGSLARIPGFFGVYWLTVIVFAWLLTKLFLQNKKVGEASKSLTNSICNALNPPKEAQ